MGRKSARKSPSQESVLQKRRFGGILVIARSRKFPVSTDMQPASWRVVYFWGFRNSIVGGDAERFGPATSNRAGILEISRAGIFELYQTHTLVWRLWVVGD
jgi:hypothetical protein